MQILGIHHIGRPDIFSGSGKKYTDSQLEEIISNDNTPVFLAVSDEGNILGHVFCDLKNSYDNNALKPIRTLFIGDLCVDENYRGSGVAKLLYNAVISFAKESGCYNITLNVWSFNERAINFYESCGFSPQSMTMEKIL